MNQFGLHYIYTWKCHKETPCIAILSKNAIFPPAITEKKKAKQVLYEEWLPWEERKTLGKGVGGCKHWKYSVHMYVNVKMRLVESVPGMGGLRIKENDGEGEFNYDKL
jgi:hypothetical protein